MAGLKVNARTKILEFKKKHNKLVDELPTEEEKETVERFKKVYLNEIPQNIIDLLDDYFDDTHFKIFLSANDLNNIVWNKLAKLIKQKSEDYFLPGLKYGEDSYNCESQTSDYIVFDDDGEGYTIGFNAYMNTNYDVIHNQGDYLNKWVYVDLQNLSYEDFENDLTIELFSEQKYEEFKSAIIADILKYLGYEIILDNDIIDEKISTAISGIQTGTKLYMHSFSITIGTNTYTLTWVSNKGTKLTSAEIISNFEAICKCRGNNSAVCGKVISFCDDAGLGFLNYDSLNLIPFKNGNFTRVYKQSSSLKYDVYPKDTINLTTGELATRTASSSGTLTLTVKDVVEL